MSTAEDHSGILSHCDSNEPEEGNVFVSAYPPFSCWNAEQTTHVKAVLEKDSRARRQVPLGIYCHIPFCMERCGYCYYRALSNARSATIDEYLNVLEAEARCYQEMPALSERTPRFIYFGGGTPAVMSARQIERLLSSLQSVLPWTELAEATFEVSPKTVTYDRLKVLFDAGITRISMGVQQLNDRVLQESGRVHLVADVLRAYAEIRRFSFPIVNLDLMVGMVGETRESFFGSLKQVIELAPESITLYQLEIPRNTRLSKDLRRGAVEQPASWVTKRARLSEAFDILESSGYTVRSAYAAVRDVDHHSFLYQDLQYRGADLVGIGLASFSFVDGVHYQNVTSLHDYYAHINLGRLPVQRAVKLSDEDRMIREFVLQLKLGQVDRRYFQKKFGVDIGAYFEVPLRRLSHAGLIEVTGDLIAPTRMGLLRVDRLLPEFYLPAHREASYW